MRMFLALIPAEIATEETAIGDVTLDADFVAGIERRAVEAYRSRVLPTLAEAQVRFPTHYSAEQKMAWADGCALQYRAVQDVPIVEDEGAE